MAGRFAPSPTGALHLGNLRTALVAWLVARRRTAAFVLRIEDLDPVASSRHHEAGQLHDLALLGIDWDGEVWRQSERIEVYAAALAGLVETGAAYECFCSRREVRAAAAAPHGEQYVYPGTCRSLTRAQRRRRAIERPPAIRFRSPDDDVTFTDALHGLQRGSPHDVVLRRNDGVPAYNLAVVIDDAEQGVDHVVRGDDLLTSTPAQVALQRALRLPPVDYAHVPMVVGASGRRLAKRDGAVTLADLADAGVDIDAVRGALVSSLGLAEPGRRFGAADVRSLATGSDLDLLVPCRRAPVSLEELEASMQASSASTATT